MVTLENPVCTHVRRTDATWEADLSFAPDAACFKGHFPGCPILPGVVQLGLAVRTAAGQLGCPADIRGVKRMKFTHIIQPGDTVHLALTRRPDGSVDYQYSKEGTPCSTGLLFY